MLPVLAAGVKQNADGRLCLWVFAWILAFGVIYPLYRNRGVLIFRRDAFAALVAGFWNRGAVARSLSHLFPWVSYPALEQGSGGKSYCLWQQKKPLSNCKPTPAPSESAGGMAACVADVSIIFNNRNTSRAGQPRGASAFMQVDEREAGCGRTRSGAASRRLFALICPLLQFLSILQKHLHPCISLLS